MLNPQTSGILTGECWGAEQVPDSSLIRCTAPVCSLLIPDILSWSTPMLANKAKAAAFLHSPLELESQSD